MSDIVLKGDDGSTIVLNAPAETLIVLDGGLRGETGAAGADGAAGPTGATGQGVPTGGTTNQYLKKNSATNYDTSWDSLDKTDVGLANVDNTADTNKPVSTAQATAISTAQTNANSYTNTQIAAIDFPVDSVAGKTGAVTLTKADVGLPNVDNTSDANKPVSTATQTALDAKQATLSLTTTGTSGAASLIGSTLNIPQYAGGGGSGETVAKTITQAAHGFSVGQTVYLNGTTYALADKDAASTAEAVGILSAVTTNTFTLVTDGYISGLSGLTAGSVYFVGDSGALTTTEPTVAGQISKPILVADTTTSGYVVNYRGIAIATSGGGSSPTTTKGDLAGFSTVSARVPVGMNNQVLVADSSTALGVAYKFLGTSSMYNYVPNPSFEVDYTGWSNYGGAGTITRDTAFAQFGAYSSKQVSATSTDGGILSSTFVLGPGTYTFSAYAKLSSDVVNACMILRGPEGVKVQINQTYPGNPDWNRYTATFTLASSGSYEILLGLGSYGAGSPGTVYYDAVQVELGATATSYFDGSTAPSGGITYSWTGASGTSQSIKATGTALTTTDYLPEGSTNQYFSSSRAISAMAGATISPTNVFANSLGSNTFRIYDPNTPASATAPGTQGEFRWDSNYLYICVAANSWKRVAIATW